MRKIFIIIFIILLFPHSINALELVPNAKSGILIEAKSGKIIFEKDKNKKYSIASLTKMVGQIIILEEIENGKIKWNDIVTVSKNASSMGGSQIYLEEGEKISVEDLMKGISVSSGNDAIVAMAEYISGTEEKFVERMNKVANKLKLKNTKFKNCTGLDEKDHYSSSYDLAIISRELIINHPEILRFSSIYEDYLRENTDRKFWLVNTNKLINFYDGADGIVLGEDNSKVRNQEMIDLLDYGFNNTKLNCLKKKNTIIDTINFYKTDKKESNVVLKNDLCVLEDKDNNSSYKFDIKYKKYNLPLKKGDTVGRIIVKNKDKIVGEEELTISNNISMFTLYEYVKNEIFGLLFGL